MRFPTMVAPLLVALAAGCDLERRPAAGAAAGGSTLVVRLTEAGGRVFDLSAERGAVVVVFFGYTTCPDVCPTTMADFVTVRRRLGDRARGVRFAFITVDPERDTPEVARRFVTQFDSTFFGLSADSATIAAAQQQFRAASWIERDSTGQNLVAHSASAYVVGKDGRLAQQVFANDTGGEALYRAVVAALD